MAQETRANGWERLVFHSFRDSPTDSHTYSGSSYPRGRDVSALSYGFIVGFDLYFMQPLCLVKHLLMFV